MGATKPRTTVSDYLRQNAIGCVALFLVLTGGTAQALDGSNTVFSDDIVNGEVTSADIAASSVTTGKIANGQVIAADVADDSLRSEEIFDGTIQAIDVAFGTLRGDEILDGTIGGADLADSDVTGADIDESSLGEVPLAEDANTAGVADIAITANTALDANQLGGLGPSNWQRDCRDGAIKGFAYVNGSATFPATFTSGPPNVAQSFNCGGGPVLVRRLSEGRYIVCFAGLGVPPGVVYANSIGTGPGTIGEDNLASWRLSVGEAACTAAGATQPVEIVIIDEGGGTTTRQDNAFSVLLV